MSVAGETVLMLTGVLVVWCLLLVAMNDRAVRRSRLEAWLLSVARAVRLVNEALVAMGQSAARAAREMNTILARLHA